MTTLGLTIATSISLPFLLFLETIAAFMDLALLSPVLVVLLPCLAYMVQFKKQILGWEVDDSMFAYDLRFESWHGYILRRLYWDCLLVTWPIVEFAIPLSYAAIMLTPVFGFWFTSTFPGLFRWMFGETPE